MSGTPSATPNAESTTPPPNEPAIQRKASRTPLYAAVAVIVIVVIIVLAAYGAGYLTKKNTTPNTSNGLAACPTGQTLLAAGASFITPIMSAWQKNYNAADGNTVSYSPSGAGAGITSLQDAQVDIATTDNPITSTLQHQMKGPILTMPITAGALAIVYNLPSSSGLTGALKLSGPTIADIYLGLITNWNDTRITANNSGFHPGNQPIYPVVREDPAGTTYVLSDFLSADSPKFNSTVGEGISVAWPTLSTETAKSGNSGIYKYVAATPYTFSYVDLTDVLNNQIQYASVLNPSGDYITPNLADSASAVADMSAKITFPAVSGGNWNNVSLVNSPDAADYPLVTFSYAFVYQTLEVGYQPSVAKAQAIAQFLGWVINESGGQSDAASLYYVNLPSAVLALDATGLSTLTFNGAAIPACG
jgi:phosphate transport system substrate-binding protein